jgi:hypothetical protein
MTKINEITPIRDGMTREEAEEATKLFLQELLVERINKNKIAVERQEMLGAKSCNIIRLQGEDTKWVKCPNNDGLQRLIGANYLANHLPTQELERTWGVVETKCVLKEKYKPTITVKISTDKLTGLPTINSNDFYTCSKYVGENRPNYNLLSDKIMIRSETGYKDFIYDSNIREITGGKIVIIDTEYSSFSNDSMTPISDETIQELNNFEFSFRPSELLGENYLG